LIARRAAELQAVAAHFDRCSLYRADVRDAASLREAAQDFIGRYGCPDIVIANAGVSYGTLTEHREDLQWIQEVMDTNVMGVVNTFHPFIEPMRAARAGVLVGIASVAGYRGLPGAEAYCASKAALISYLESLRARLRRDGLHVATICPGYVATAMTADNPYRMPFLLDADAAAERIVRLIARRAGYAVIPWQMAIVARILRVLPNRLFDCIFADAPRKPRRRGEP
jgi:short-subunit dehydrogenase